MIVYRSEERRMATGGLFEEVRNAADAREALIAFGELEAGLCDLMPVPGIRRAAVACGRWFCGSESGRDEFRTAIASLETASLPAEVRVPAPEGYAFYALYPETYREAARQFVEECSPAQAAVIGIRTIGTSLSAAVAGALAESGVMVSSWTVRPTGHPFDRELKVRERVRTAWGALARTAWFAIVDEGPGLSGSSFLSVIRAARDCGVPDERIVLFPSWLPDGGEFVNELARAQWPRFRKFRGNYEPALPGGPFEEVSGGRWRDVLGVDAPAHPRHEARKFLSPGGRLFKFSGLGRYGREKLCAAEALAAAGYSPCAHGVHDGFIEFDFVPGTPLKRKDASPPFLDFMARYIAFRAARLPALTRSAGFDQMMEMMEFNSGLRFPALQQCRREFEDRAPVHVDGRMMPHEWIAAGGGWLKTDSIDHSRDHFFPGQADPLWDLAGALAEFELSPDGRRYLVDRYRSAAHDRFSPELLEFYETAYRAFRLGYAAMFGAPAPQVTA